VIGRTVNLPPFFDASKIMERLAITYAGEEKKT
jgi:hypothetical protein